MLQVKITDTCFEITDRNTIGRICENSTFGKTFVVFKNGTKVEQFKKDEDIKSKHINNEAIKEFFIFEKNIKDNKIEIGNKTEFSIAEIIELNNIN